MNRTLVVLKFGSSVLEDRHCLPKVVHEVYRHYRRGHRVLAVVSALGGTTDRLLKEARYWSIPPKPGCAVAELPATGERQSAALLTLVLARAGIDAGLLSPANIKLTLTGDRLDAWPISVSGRTIARELDKTPVLVLPGFAGVHEHGGTALLGRGGTDLTAVFLARALDAIECRLVKDVDGIYERDPALGWRDGIEQERPQRYSRITYEEALRISGKLVQPKAIEYLKNHQYCARVAAILHDEATEIGAPVSVRHDLPAPSAPLKVLLLGQVGQGVCGHLQSLTGRFEFAGILVREVSDVSGLIETDLDVLLERPHDLVIDVCGDVAIGKRALETALAAGRPAITAAKRLMAEHGPALATLAAKSGTRLRYAAAVGGAAPMIETLEHALKEGPVTRLRGVLNGTCNFVLDALASGAAFHTAVSQARLRGFAEANVSHDLQGDDSADKLRILARLAFGKEADGLPIAREGLSPNEMGLFHAGAGGGVLRQIASFDPGQGGSVKLERLPAADYLAGARGEENRLVISGSQGRKWRVSGKGAGRWPTAEAVLADALDIHAWLAENRAVVTHTQPTARTRRRSRATAA